MCKRHSFIVTRAGDVHDGHGITDRHTLIRQLAGMSAESDAVNAYEWQPPAGWPDADWSVGLTKDFEAYETKAKHHRAMERHLRRRYPTMVEWNTSDMITALPEGLSVGGSLYLRGTAITALPKGLSVGGYLDLQGTAITALPKGLSVGGSLYLQGTAITALPEGLSKQAIY